MDFLSTYGYCSCLATLRFRPLQVQANSFPWQSPLPCSNSLPATCTTGQSKVAAWLQDSEEMDRCAEGQFLPGWAIRMRKKKQKGWVMSAAVSPPTPRWPLPFLFLTHVFGSSSTHDPSFLRVHSPAPSQLLIWFVLILTSIRLTLLTSSHCQLPPGFISLPREPWGQSHGGCSLQGSLQPLPSLLTVCEVLSVAAFSAAPSHPGNKCTFPGDLAVNNRTVLHPTAADLLVVLHSGSVNKYSDLLHSALTLPSLSLWNLQKLSPPLSLAWTYWSKLSAQAISILWDSLSSFVLQKWEKQG